MADSGTVETPLSQAESTVFVKDGSVHSRFAAGKKPATDASCLPQTHVSAHKFSRREKARIYKGLKVNLVNRKILRECSKNAKKANDKAQSLS
ncbi:hypothetical protein GCM10010520_24690 [Rhizobium viscosum]|uniref:Uncharacterized protein n=1 Tax=Rhizobium viscosum TaxID=1673 RepID=A0ABR9IJ75_RHIVS|nr:hypothetical protein [Rhizobium viscosum]MBE1503243.1 hypothetical protein [Rhizobium viscosum]